MSEPPQKLERDSVQFMVNEELFETVNEKSKLGDALIVALSHGFGIPKDRITFHCVHLQLTYSEGKRIHVAEKALMTILVNGVEEPDIRKQANMILNVISGTTKVKDSEVEIVQIVPKRSCLLVIRLPGLAMLRLIIAFFSLQSRPVFLQQLTAVLPESAFEVRFGFGSLPYCWAVLPSRHRTQDSGDNTHQVGRPQQSGKLPLLIMEIGNL